MGWDQLLEMKKAAEEQAPKERTLCPNCAYPLEESEIRGKHCQFCGWTEQLFELLMTVIGN